MKLKSWQRPPGREHVHRVSYEYFIRHDGFDEALCSLFTSVFRRNSAGQYRGQPLPGPASQEGLFLETGEVVGRGYVPSCPSQKFVKKDEGDKSGGGGEGRAHLLPGGDQVLVGFEDVSQSFLDVFLLHAGQHSGGQEQRQTPLLPVRAEACDQHCAANCRHRLKLSRTWSIARFYVKDTPPAEKTMC